LDLSFLLAAMVWFFDIGVFEIAQTSSLSSPSSFVLQIPIALYGSAVASYFFSFFFCDFLMSGVAIVPPVVV